MIRDPELINQLVDTIARFVRERLIPNEARLAEEDAVPPEILAEMKEMGLFGLSIPEEYGGLGLTMEEEAWKSAKRLPPFARCLVPTTALVPRAF